MPRRSSGEGSIARRTDGRWQASLQVEGRRRTVYGRTRGEAAQRLDELRRLAAIAGTLPDPGLRTLGDLLDAWLEAKAPTLRARTLSDYAAICRLYVPASLRSLHLSKVSPDRVQRQCARLQARGLHCAALHLYRVLSQALALGARWGWLASNPCERVDAPRYRPERKVMWSPGELGRFLEGTRDHWLYPLWTLLACAGLRIGEALALEWADVDLRAGAVTVAKSAQRIDGARVVTAPKTPAGVRTLRLPALAVAALTRQAEWRLAQGGGAGPVFAGPRGGPLSQSTASHAMRRECERLRLPVLTPHGLRHLHASLLLSEGLSVPEVSRRLGHAHPGVTMSVYAHAMPGGDDRAAAAMARALRSSSGYGAEGR